MRRDAPLLTYCSNIHPGEAWADVRANLAAHTLQVRKETCPDAPFPLGLRISARAAYELDDDETRRFGDWCAENGLFVLTLNGFPYGQFHGTGVKEKVYLPDWRDPRRVEYTRRLADLLAAWLPAGMPGSISTCPIAFKPGFDESVDGSDWDIVRRHLVEVAEHLDGIRQRTGRVILLALEPEPLCVLETTSQVIKFFEAMEFSGPAADLIGICFDACHQAVEFEDPAFVWEVLRRKGVRVAKVQVSSALCAREGEIAGLERFDEPTYLHQVVARFEDGALRRFADLPEFHKAVDESPVAPEEARCHFHVPIFAGHLGGCGTTRFFLEDLLPRIDPSIPLEVETYSWDVLPAELRTGSVAESIVRELRWVSQTLE